MSVAELTTSIQYTRIVSYAQVASIVILSYDTLLTLDREINTIWRSKFSVMKLMYLITRYSAFVEGGVVIAQLSIPGDWYVGCSLTFKLNACLFVFGMGVGEIIMTNRTWVVWQKNRTMMFALPIFYVTLWSGGFAAIAIFLGSIKFDPNPRTPYVGCYATAASPIIFICWVLIFVYDLVMLILMAIPTFRVYRSGGSSRFMRMVYRDGVVYYIYLFALSLVNIIIALTFPTDLILIFSLMLRIIHALLACRVVLHIKEYANRVGDVSGQAIPILSLPNHTHPPRKSQSQFQ
ncbi:hypothetical protein HYPSUDRAFT_38111 [Hypholoma sublateritium FD-334 SS-4]|uniref:DUF6533 domain-containing protein n=1 Tax=Hypholoma sublateritium (strain FD-334 SS-4) TaxID=945553 RepID=A0A0D2P2K6_HYPSF|nr:hypothetical protein HYPSUDRAFT_38111 [Hypholoma sublateritium FD-334 SS-4]